MDFNLLFIVCGLGLHLSSDLGFTTSDLTDLLHSGKETQRRSTTADRVYLFFSC